MTTQMRGVAEPELAHRMHDPSSNGEPGRQVYDAGSRTWAERARSIGSHVIWPVAAFALVIGLWYLVVAVAGQPRSILPTPQMVASSFHSDWSVLMTNAWVTLKETLLGFALAFVIGVPIAMGIAFSQILDRLLYPIIVVMQAVPKIVIAPLFVLWFGFGMTSNVLIALLIALFPIVVNAALGLSSLEPDLLRLARIMGGNRRRVFWKVRVPTALPSLFAGLKMAVTFAVLGAVAGELIAGQSGLGYVINAAAGNLNAGLTFAGIVTLAVMGVVLFYAVVAIESVALRWRK